MRYCSQVSPISYQENYILNGQKIGFKYIKPTHLSSRPSGNMEIENKDLEFQYFLKMPFCRPTKHNGLMILFYHYLLIFYKLKQKGLS